jgi:hypothetical protein
MQVGAQPSMPQTQDDESQEQQQLAPNTVQQARDDIEQQGGNHDMKQDAKTCVEDKVWTSERNREAVNSP